MKNRIFTPVKENPPIVGLRFYREEEAQYLG